MPDSFPDIHTDKQACCVAVLTGRLKNTKKQAEDLDNITLRETERTPQSETLSQQQPRGQLTPWRCWNRKQVSYKSSSGELRKVWITHWGAVRLA